MTRTATPNAPAQPVPQPPSPPVQAPLFDLLARSWSFDAAVADVCLDRAGKAAGFALADGRVALVPLKDPDSPLKRMRVEADSGRSIIRPREHPVAMPILTTELAGSAPLLTASGTIGLIAASRDGRLHRITPRGQVIALLDGLGPVLAIASDRAGRLAIGRDDRADLHQEEGMARIGDLPTPGPVNALAFAPDDGMLAVMLADALLLGGPGKAVQTRPLGGDGPLVFSADGVWLAGSNGEDGFWLMRRADGQIARIDHFREAPSSIAFSAAGAAVFAAGAFRAAGWSLATPRPDAGADATLQIAALRTGRSGLVLVQRIAAHPRRDLIALGASDGSVAVAKIGQPQEMVLRQADGSAITALAWSADGLHLAIGTAAGHAALMTLPQQLFK